MTLGGVVVAVALLALVLLLASGRQPWFVPVEILAALAVLAAAAQNINIYQIYFYFI